MSEMLLVAIFAGTEGTTSTVFEHRRRHLLSAGDVPSPRVAPVSSSTSRSGANFLHDGVAILDHHAARSIQSVFT
jgi:hypothetical protein